MQGIGYKGAESHSLLEKEVFLLDGIEPQSLLMEFHHKKCSNEGEVWIASSIKEKRKIVTVISWE